MHADQEKPPLQQVLLDVLRLLKKKNLICNEVLHMELLRAAVAAPVETVDALHLTPDHHHRYSTPQTMVPARLTAEPLVLPMTVLNSETPRSQRTEHMFAFIPETPLPQEPGRHVEHPANQHRQWRMLRPM